MAKTYVRKTRTGGAAVYTMTLSHDYSDKEHQKMLAGIDKNDEVVTLGGIHGTVVNVKEKTLTLRIDENVKMEIEKNSVAYIKKPN